MPLGVSVCLFARLRYLHRAFSRPDSSLLYTQPVIWPLSSESGATVKLAPCGVCLLVLPWQYAFAACGPVAVDWANGWFSSGSATRCETHQCRLSRHRHLLSLCSDGSATSLARIDRTDVSVSNALSLALACSVLPMLCLLTRLAVGSVRLRGPDKAGSVSMFRNVHRII